MKRLLMLQNHIFFILDDMMRSSNSSDISELYTEGSHHRNLSIICLLQNLFNKGKEARTISLNNHYLALFKNPRDMQQISVLARQMYPGNIQHFMNKFKEATSKPYGSLLVDLKPDTQDRDRLKSQVLPQKQASNSEGNRYLNMTKQIYEPASKRFKISDNTKVFQEWIQNIVKANDQQWHTLTDEYKRQGLTQT